MRSTGTGSTRISRRLSQFDPVDGAGSQDVTVALIVAAAENGVIGRDGGLPWRLSGDLRYFKSVTMGKPIIMGRKTFESIGRPLPGRPNLVVSRNPDFSADGVEVFSDLEAAVAHAGTLVDDLADDDVMVIGGAGLYRAALAIAGRIYLTEVHAAVVGDVTFPAFDRADWVETSRERHSAGEKDEFDHSFVVLERVTSA
ncbi:MAG: dihydrofolate reductase [Paracoccaceae bacterium]